MCTSPDSHHSAPRERSPDAVGGRVRAGRDGLLMRGGVGMDEKLKEGRANGRMDVWMWSFARGSIITRVGL